MFISKNKYTYLTVTRHTDMSQNVTSHTEMSQIHQMSKHICTSRSTNTCRWGQRAAGGSAIGQCVPLSWTSEPSPAVRPTSSLSERAGRVDTRSTHDATTTKQQLHRTYWCNNMWLHRTGQSWAATTQNGWSEVTGWSSHVKWLNEVSEWSDWVK